MRININNPLFRNFFKVFQITLFIKYKPLILSLVINGHGYIRGEQINKQLHTRYECFKPIF